MRPGLSIPCSNEFFKKIIVYQLTIYSCVNNLKMIYQYSRTVMFKVAPYTKNYLRKK